MTNNIGLLIKTKGIFNYLKIFLSLIIKQLLAVMSALIIMLISPIVRVRFVHLFSSRIGHYSINTEILLCASDVKLKGDRYSKTFFYTVANEPICNKQLHKMWKRVIPILPFPSIIAKVDSLLLRYGGKKYKDCPIKKLQIDCRDRYGLLEKVKKCHLSFTPEELKRGKEILSELGVPPGQPFVCLLVRDSGYLNTYMPSVDWSYHDYRNADINAYKLAANYLADSGYYVMRVGKFVKDPFSIENAKVIDYANNPLASDFMDIYLSAHCTFFLSTCTGLDSVARTFRKPLLITNLVLADFDIWHPWELFIPKKILNLKTGNILTTKEMHTLYFQMKFKKQIPQLMLDNGLCYVDNSPEEIRNVVEEMLGKLTGRWRYSEEDEQLQKLFWKDYPKYLTNDNLSELHIPISETIKMRVGANFLKNNQGLFRETNEIQVDIT